MCIRDSCNTWRINVNADKTQICVFNSTGRNMNHFFTTPVRVGPPSVRPKRECQYLGVTLDSKLTWRPHIKRTSTLARVRIRSLRTLIRHNRSSSEFAKSYLHHLHPYDYHLRTSYSPNHWPCLPRSPTTHRTTSFMTDLSQTTPKQNLPTELCMLKHFIRSSGHLSLIHIWCSSAVV